jgi:phosphohistidine phosphatase
MKANNDNNDNHDTNELQTTNAEDQAAVAALRKRLEGVNANTNASSSRSVVRVPKVQIANGAHKYVLVEANAKTASNKAAKEHFVISKRGAAYHRNAAEPLLHQLEQSNHHNIRVTGGGRISFDESKQTIHIFGYSYGFGLADHQLTKQVIQSDPRYRDYDITWSNDGY